MKRTLTALLLSLLTLPLMAKPVKNEDQAISMVMKSVQKISYCLYR
ncbi:hypothetical protein HT662_02940 [Ursidibacter maritimus]|uniref:Uncharacterized protein n=1 Tax=Ursidibacter maritimus TaxID=1331689 RepID=A0A949T460_9PAST|nr:hypothetical protein [Ursidibacter maritimus]MBV6524585.1 hypothetical protein [Ursidibacter maritimus]MBV6525440.1 hypothetical protein [Ursidibacter maritimus]MBV6526910.1 hypothetical protein [Ursidibacter maritimus]MBV6530373.1 hypothetical protein [Ursidibacter maritimus]MBV6531248.1 hypothetical protein [Ursidibacter maritimus]